MADLPPFTAVMLHKSVMDTRTDCKALVQGRGEGAVLPAVTAVLLNQSVIDTWTECNEVSTG